MNTVLNITNGSCAIDVMRQGGIPSDFLSWDDVLHEGPVLDGVSLSEFSKIRASHIASLGWDSEENVITNFTARNQKLESYPIYCKVILWFEHDLYDQLQILQILNWFADQIALPKQFSIICTEQYLGVIKPENMTSLFQYEQKITQQHLILAKTAWQAFCSDTPSEWVNLLQTDTTVLPFLQGAMVRLLEEYPHPKTGLSRIQTQALRIIEQDQITAIRLFCLYQETEERRFLGDLCFWAVLQQMLSSTPPLITLSENSSILDPSNKKQTISITSTAQDILQERLNWLEIQALDKWLGGVHLTPENCWFWTDESGLQLNKI